MPTRRATALTFHALLLTTPLACLGDGPGAAPTADGTTGEHSTGWMAAGTEAETGDTSDGSGAWGTDTTGTTDNMLTTGSTSTGASESGSTTGDPGNEGRPDLDGDGLIDFVFSARAHDDFAGAVWIDYGSDAIDEGPDGADTQLDGGMNLGLATTACDLDGDEMDELIVGSLAGIHVYWGGARLENGATEDLLITAAGQLSVVRGLGCADATGDGTPDIVALGRDFESWQLTVIPGSDGLRGMAALDADTDPSTIVITSDDGSLLPAFDLGDVNGDDVVDVVVGAPFAGAAIDPEGAAYVFFGGATLASSTASDADVTLPGMTPSGGFGSSVAVGDFDGDLTDDIAVSEAGRIAIYRGEAAFPEQELRFSGNYDLPASAFVVLADDGEREALAIGIRSSAEPSNEAFVILDRVFEPNIFACGVALDGEDQTPPVPVSSVFTPIIRGPDDSIFAVPVFRHGRTDPITFQPAGDGALQVFEWAADDCRSFASQQEFDFAPKDFLITPADPEWSQRRTFTMSGIRPYVDLGEN